MAFCHVRVYLVKYLWEKYLYCLLCICNLFFQSVLSWFVRRLLIYFVIIIRFVNFVTFLGKCSFFAIKSA